MSTSRRRGQTSETMLAQPHANRESAYNRRLAQDHPQQLTTESPATEGTRYFVQSLARGLDVVRAFGPNGGSLTLGEIAKRAGMSRAAARRYVLTLRDLDYIQVRGAHFELKARLLELGYSYLSSLPLWKVAEPVLTELVDRVHETCSVSVLDVPDIVYVSRVAVKRIVSSNVSIGTRLPAFATAMGRVLLAALSEKELRSYIASVELSPITRYTLVSRKKLLAAIEVARAQGFAIVDNEFAIGLHSIAVPVRDRSGSTIAALNLSMSAPHGEAAGLSRHLDGLLEASQELTAGLPY